MGAVSGTSPAAVSAAADASLSGTYKYSSALPSRTET